MLESTLQEFIHTCINNKSTIDTDIVITQPFI